MKRPGLLAFLIAEALVSLFVFRDALWGKSLLAPLDIAAVSCYKYGFVDPNHQPILQNQWLGDQLVYDLPLQYTIHQAYAVGEIPWWDPYTFAGRPLLADAHINGTDPVRVLCYLLLPFVSAYNWTRVLHFFLGGLGFFALLSHLKCPPVISISFALAGQFAGFYTWFFGHPWIQGSFIYYPFLWVVWDAALEKPRWWTFLAGPLLVAGVFYAGNLQSHAYIVLFAGAYAAAHAGRDLQQWRAVLKPIGLSLVAGGCLAAPVLSGELEFFLLGVRSAKPAFTWRAWLCGLLTCTSIYPWTLGSFRTVDLRNTLWTSGNGQENGLGFLLFIGSAGLLLAASALFFKPADPPRLRSRRIALALWATLLVVLSSPLISIFYPRAAALGGLGIVVLAALACHHLLVHPAPYPRFGWTVIGLTVLLAVSMHAAALVVYPRLVPRLKQMLQARDASNAVFSDVTPAIREFQLTNLPNEVTWKNPAALAASVSLLVLGLILVRPALRRKPWPIPLMLFSNLAAVLFFAQRFVPHHPVRLWENLLAGGPEQRKVMTALHPQALRLFEEAPGQYDFLFPKAFPHFYKVHTVHGYSALFLLTFQTLTPEVRKQFQKQLADYIYVSPQRGLTAGEFSKNDVPGFARFQWLNGSNRTISVQEHGLTRLSLKFSPGPAGTLVRTDSFYPGWRASLDGRPIPTTRREPFFSSFEIPADATLLELTYRPRFLTAGLIMAIATVLFLAFGGWRWRSREIRGLVPRAGPDERSRGPGTAWEGYGERTTPDLNNGRR